MDKNKVAKTPPMGWNSWDCYGASVNEEQLRGNAEFIANHLKDYGWEYVVCDIQWYEPKAKSTQYNAFYPLTMDAFARLIPAENRFPSATGGKGFKPIADYVHSLGLKFGIHIMRGVPRQAVHVATPLRGIDVTARDIAHPFSVCSWNTDMYGVNPNARGAQEYYNSLFELYAEWCVDFVKVDDISNTEYKPHDPYSAQKEIELIRRAIDVCGREMVLSLSPGPAVLKEAEHLSKHANMWRMTGDFWDNWTQLYNMFEKCNEWSPYVGDGCWPDCDMLPVGEIAVNNDPKRQTARRANFSRDEQVTLLSMWCIFRSPLMLGAELRTLDDWTLKLITNREILDMHKYSSGARQIMRTIDTVIWSSHRSDGKTYVAFFNTSFAPITPEIGFLNLGIRGKQKVRNLWTGEELGIAEGRIGATVRPHGAEVYCLG